MDFFNGLGKGLGKKFSSAARTVQERTRETVESTRLASELRNARNDLELQLAELGRAYYQSVTGGPAEIPDELVARVRSTLELIDNLTQQRERIRQQLRCPGCGAVQAEGARYCSNCGRRMPEDAPTPAVDDGDDEYCEECGAMRHGDSAYCPVCGHAFASDDNLPDAPRKAAPPASSDAMESPEEPDSFGE